jgi:PIN domain nuclease of toxin-antitoxin system
VGGARFQVPPFLNPSHRYHRDPFDRMIAAQALAGDLPILSSDSELDVFSVRRIW